MKRILSIAAVVFLLFSLVLSASAAEVGEQVDWVLYTDIVTYIDGCPIRSYNIGGYTYVVAEDLAQYGFAVEWLPAPKKLSVLAQRTRTPERYISNYSPVSDEGKRPGDLVLPVLHTDIVTEIRGKAVTSYNIGGYTCIGVDDLAAGFAEEYVWDGDARTLSLTTRQEENWNFVYETPEYHADTPVYGEYAVWEFAKDENGEFVLTHGEGSTDFTPRITFGAAEVTYQVPFVTKFLKGGARFFENAPHKIDAHTRMVEAELFLLDSRGGQKNGAILSPDGGAWIYPERYRSYCEANEEYASYLRGCAAESGAIWRVYYNGEAVDGVALQESLYPYVMDGAETQTFTYRFGQLYESAAVTTVRIELRLPEESEPYVTEIDSVSDLQARYRSYTTTSDFYTPHDFLESFIFRIRPSGVTVHIETDEKASPFITCIERDGMLTVFDEPLSLTDAVRAGYLN